MKYAVLLIVPIVFLATAALMAAGCSTGNGVAGGGDKTANFFAEVEALRMKMAECAPGEVFLEWETPPNSLPVLDGLAATLAEELHNAIEYANSTSSCEDFFTALNSDIPPGTCETPGRSCEGKTAKICLQGKDRRVGIDIDCGSMDMACLDGTCTLGICETSQCDGDTLVTCDEQNLRQEFRCGYLDLGCGYGDSALQCVGTGEQCSTTTVAATCADNVLNFCLGGRLAAMSCAEITDGRRECNQSWLDSNPDVSSLDLVTRYLDKVCSQKYAECDEGVSVCSADGEARFCRDGVYDDIYCPYYGFEQCTPAGGERLKAACTGFIEIQ